MLVVLDSAESIKDMDLPGYDLHLLHPKRDKIYAAKVSGNWRLTFRFIDANAEVVNYLDYH